MRTERNKKAEPELTSEVGGKTELSEMNLESMDFEIVKKILADHIADDIGTDGDSLISEDERFLELEVISLEEGLKDASQLLEVPLKEIKYKLIEKYLKIIDGEQVEFQKIEFKRKLVSGESEIQVSEDKLSVHFSVIFPKNMDGEDINRSNILEMLKEEGIEFGILNDEIEKTIKKLGENYDALKNVLVAVGEEPKKGKTAKWFPVSFRK